MCLADEQFGHFQIDIINLENAKKCNFQLADDSNESRCKICGYFKSLKNIIARCFS